ncbi:hypothetical protein OR60_07865 [Xanthomonas vesicatoria]|uniref:Uncharacterized protein n=2 Tax=Xanthomonas vesicatoria TaxID=56460 RepID=A0AAJ0IY23_9XANT|nr:hypothetical protein XVE_2121 [Xanthomonas vesicatoria ATCC 35937]KHM94460.1 hypothetical protein OR61_11545 [Xanthomonas vesicatoria]KHM95613.1 hypothetical protein OR60_07865 [Xanthomonas vesicatoria]KTF32668.1 hypothetical protein LMG920_12270 [Xanthomonas vesicatoria]KTF37597.1 hypothetical protein LMG919_06445 [Xanthomonas vesicatoria]
MRVLHTDAPVARPFKSYRIATLHGEHRADQRTWRACTSSTSGTGPLCIRKDAHSTMHSPPLIPLHLPQHGDVPQRIAADRDQIGIAAWRNGSDVVTAPRASWQERQQSSPR